MARAQKLKVYRTPIGFHDAYVAVPSQKAALEAWGTDANLFARGVAELVTDEALAREPLANPGKVIKRSRGSVEEQLAALPDDQPKAKAKPGRKASSAASKTRPRPKPKPRPSRAKLDDAEQHLADLIARQEDTLAELKQREQALQHERRDLERRQDRDRRNAEDRAERERKAHVEALSRWRESS